MRAPFYLGLALLVLFELANVYFIMPMPYSQRWESIGIAYVLYSWRWAFRMAAVVLMVAGSAGVLGAGRWQKRGALLLVLVAAAVVYATNFVLAADAIFLQPSTVTMEPRERNVVAPERVIIGLELNGEARAYPVQLIGYHHQVRDTIGQQAIMVTFCTVCRTGRIFSPTVDGRVETFRLVGMDQFNAMFEDATTGSWWRQATGEAIAGPRKGKQLPDIYSEQMTLAQWLTLYPHSLIMQPDPALRDRYSESFDYETGKSRSALTGTDVESWKEKSWVVGIAIDGHARAYDWNRLRRERIINDQLGQRPILLVLAADNVSFFAYERPNADIRFSIADDRLIGNGGSYDLRGRSDEESLRPVFASQEFWHSWRSFHPGTDTY